MIVKAEMGKKRVNVLLDTGAGVSLIDAPTLKDLVRKSEIVKSNRTLVDASRKVMTMMVEFVIPVKISGLNTVFEHTFSVLDIETPKNIIVGRDFLSRYGEVAFDFNTRRVCFDGTWIEGVKVSKNSYAKVCSNHVLAPRSEVIVSVKCKHGMSGMPLDLIPSKSIKIPNLYVPHCRVIPNNDGVFLIKVLNTSEREIILSKRHNLGRLTLPNDIHSVLEVNHSKDVEGKESDMDKLNLGEGMTSMERDELVSLIDTYRIPCRKRYFTWKRGPDDQVEKIWR